VSVSVSVSVFMSVFMLEFASVCLSAHKCA